MKTSWKVGIAAGVAMCGVGMVDAAVDISETVDLKGQRVVYNEQLKGNGSFINSSEEQATLVINVGSKEGRSNFSGTISGNIRVEVLGSNAFQGFTSPGNRYTGGTYIEKGYLYIATTDNIGTGPLELTQNGRLVKTGKEGAPEFTGTVNRVLTNSVVVTGTGRLGVYNYHSLTVAGDVVLKDATLELWNAGTFTFTKPFTADNVRGGTFNVKSAKVKAAPGVFGSDPDHVLPMTIRFEDVDKCNPVLSLSGDAAVCVSNVVYATAQTVSSCFTESAVKVATGGANALEGWRTDAGVKVFGEITVNDYATIVQRGVVAIMPRAKPFSFYIPANASLTFADLLSFPKGPDGQARGFVKRGPGTLVLEGGTDATGTISVEAGTLKIGKGARFHALSALQVSPAAKLELADGAVLPCPVTANDAALVTTADVWFDATAITGVSDGGEIGSIPNLGTAGGTFVPATADGAPHKPKYAANAINGLPALNVNSSDGVPCGLCLTAYTNKTATITYFQVVLFDSWGSGRNKWSTAMATRPAGTDSSKDLWDTKLGFAYRFNNAAGPSSFQIRNNDKTDTWDLTGKWPGVGTPICFSTCRNGAAKNHQAFWMASETGTKEIYDTTAGGAAAFDISFISLGAASYQNGKAIAGRVFPGKIGEIVLFTRALSDDEIESVNAYLRRKWMGYEAAGGGAALMRPGQDVEVFVSASARASLVPGGVQTDAGAAGCYVKTGAGMLALAGSAANCASIAVAEGGLALADGATPSCAAVWLDAADEDTFAFDGDGKVESVVNKGSAGGRFTQSPGTKNRPTRVMNAINDRPALQFDFHSALSLYSWTNKTEGLPRNIHIYGVLKRTRYYLDENPTAESGWGKWSGPFSFYCSAFTEDDQMVKGNFHWEERLGSDPVSDSIAFYFGSDSHGISPTGSSQWVIPNTCFSTGDPYLFTSHQMTYAVSTAFEKASDDPAAVTLLATNAPSAYVSPFLCDVVMLGGRMTGGGVAQDSDAAWKNRMWHGQVGEFIVMDRLPTAAEDAAIVAYLRKKWLGKGDASAEPPVCLSGVSGRVTQSDGLGLSLAPGTTLEHAGSTLALASFDATDATVLRTPVSSDPAAFALFDVSGDLTLSGTISFACDPAPTADAPLFSYGSRTDTSHWTVTVPGFPQARAGDRSASSAYWLTLRSGTLLLVR